MTLNTIFIVVTTINNHNYKHLKNGYDDKLLSKAMSSGYNPTLALHLWYLVSCLLIANMISFVKISIFSSEKNIYIMTFRVAHWDTLTDSFVF